MFEKDEIVLYLRLTVFPGRNILKCGWVTINFKNWDIGWIEGFENPKLLGCDKRGNTWLELCWIEADWLIMEDAYFW